MVGKIRRRQHRRQGRGERLQRHLPHRDGEASGGRSQSLDRGADRQGDARRIRRHQGIHPQSAADAIKQRQGRGLRVGLLHRRGRRRRKNQPRCVQRQQRARLEHAEQRHAAHHIHQRREGPARSVHHEIQGRRQVLHARHRSQDLGTRERQRAGQSQRFRRIPGERLPVHRSVGIHRLGELGQAASCEGQFQLRGQHLGAGSLLGF